MMCSGGLGTFQSNAKQGVQRRLVARVSRGSRQRKEGVQAGVKRRIPGA